MSEAPVSFVVGEPEHEAEPQSEPDPGSDPGEYQEIEDSFPSESGDSATNLQAQITSVAPGLAERRKRLRWFSHARSVVSRR